MSTTSATRFDDEASAAGGGYSSDGLFNSGRGAHQARMPGFWRVCDSLSERCKLCGADIQTWVCQPQRLKGAIGNIGVRSYWGDFQVHPMGLSAHLPSQGNFCTVVKRHLRPGREP